MSNMGEQFGKLAENIAKEKLDEMEREVRSFHAQQKGRTPAAIQADYKRKFGKALSDEDARSYAAGAQLSVTKSIRR